MYASNFFNLNKLVIIKNVSIIARPLYELLKKDTPFILSPKKMKIYEYLKSLLILPPILLIYSIILETQINCDALFYGHSLVLMQKQFNSKFHPVAHFSKITTPTENIYIVLNLKCLQLFLLCKDLEYIYKIQNSKLLIIATV